MGLRVKSISDLQSKANSDTTFQEELKTDPIGTINALEEKNPLSTDAWIYRIIVIALGITIISIVIGVIILMSSGIVKSDTNVPTILTAIGSAAIGALAGLLAPSPKE